MFAAAVVWFACTVWLLGDDTISSTTSAVLTSITLTLWAVFIVDFIVRLVLAPQKGQFLRRRWFDLLSIVVPFLRAFLIVGYVWRLPVFERSAVLLRARLMVCVPLFALLFVYTASTAVWFAERRHPHASIVNLGDAIWWGFTTITTVGYGDYTPVTVTGRFVAICLMVGGIFVVGITSALFISALTDQVTALNRHLQQEHQASRAAAKREGGHTVEHGPTHAGAPGHDMHASAPPGLGAARPAGHHSGTGAAPPPDSASPPPTSDR